MARTRKASSDLVWRVRHPNYETAIVIAPNWEQATVKAAKRWKVPWREAAALCKYGGTAPFTRNVCMGCGMIFHNMGPFCSRCLTAQQDTSCRHRAGTLQHKYS